jgi:ABC-type transport system involved in multi-copper enzyme maturation permease subunit
MIGRLWRLTRFEFKKLWGRRTMLVPQGLYTRLPKSIQAWAAPPFILIVFFVLASATFVSGYGEWVFDQAKKLTTGQESDPFKNAWSTMARSASNAKFLAIIVLLIMSGTSLAEEAQYGTMKALLVRPYRRWETIIAKALTLSLFVMAIVGVLGLAGIVTGSMNYPFSHVVDPNYKDYVNTTASNMWIHTGVAFLMLIPPLFAMVAYGMFLSITIEQPGYAVGVAIGGILVIAAIGFVYEDAAQYSLVHWSFVPLQALQDIGASFSGADADLSLVSLGKSTAVCGVTGVVFHGLTIWRLAVRDIGD